MRRVFLDRGQPLSVLLQVDKRRMAVEVAKLEFASVPRSR